jgi:hypothetical protein
LNQTTQYFQLEGTFPQNDLDLLRASSDIETMELLQQTPSLNSTTLSVMFYLILIDLIRTNTPWGLGRISTEHWLANQNPAHLTFTYAYNLTAGFGVDIYVLGMHSRNTLI